MHIFGKILNALQFTAETPQLFGWFHILSFVIAIGLGIFLSIKFKGCNERTVRKILLIASLVTIGAEIYKQTVYSFSYADGALTFDYQWYAFPFQFCSTPMYVQLLAALTKKGRIHDALCAFLSSYAIFGGLAVMVYPGDVFTSTVGINFQTMICHGLMLAMGIFLLGSGYVEIKHKKIIPALCVFLSLISTAVLLNEVMYYSGLLDGETFNMFFISRHFPAHLPVYSSVQAVIPYPFSVIIYIFGFTAAAHTMLLCAMGIKKICVLVKKRIAFGAII